MMGELIITGQLHNLEAQSKLLIMLELCVDLTLHAAGNVPLRLHDLDVDFACWCTYKYLNSALYLLVESSFTRSIITADYQDLKVGGARQRN